MLWRTPDAVKQQRWDAKQARKAATKAAHRHEPGSPLVGRGAMNLIWVMLAACVVGLVFLALR